ncbi:MAG: hypothetical protein JNL65_09185 [Saprospiraceae bacterium]|nr:hypothetical protein [Saprospiraceae bacterium]HRG69396.1 hypothetical protein [Saprospiraceae bacterium]
MKPLFFLILNFLSFTIWAQEPEKEVKKADSKVASFYLDPTANVSKLWEAKALIDGASDHELVNKSARTWAVKGKVYNAICSHESDSILIGQQFGRPYKVKYKDAAIIAYTSWLKSKELATKGHESKDALEALTETYRYLNNYGIQAYEAGDFKSAFNHFDAVVKINDMLLAGGMKGVLATSEDLNKQKYLAAACAINANMLDTAFPYLEDLRKVNYSESFIYEGLYKYYLERDEKKAEEALAEGRQKFPNETALLFNEINHYLKKGRLNELVDKLKIAVEKEPGNVSVRTTLGNVYDNLCQKEWEAANFEKGNEYYTQAEKYYKEALTIAASDFNSLYSLGALYYNKAALISKEANKLSSDYSKEGTRKYNEKKAEMESYFDKALPYFEQAEKIEPKDKNTLIALKEIFAKKSQFDKSNAYKSKLEALGN